MTALWAAWAGTFMAAVLLVLTRRWHGSVSMDGLDGIQKLHSTPTPRIGGLAIAAGLVAGWSLTTDEVRELLGTAMLAGIPAFAAGLLEDTTKKVSVLARLIATLFSGGLAWYLTGVAMQNTGLPPFDMLLAFTPAAVLFTAFAVGGVANAINIIDGFNGLAAGAVAIMLMAMALISLQVGDVPLLGLCLVLACVSLGFWVVNWPYGYLFLGDGGAYLLGFLLAWVAVLLPMRNPQVTAWTTLMVCAYPVMEVGFSYVRRSRRAGHRPGEPDRAHLHHFLHRRLVRSLFPGLGPRLQNGLTSPFCWVATALPAAWAVAFPQNPWMLFAGLLLCVGLYAVVYSRLTQFRWLPRSRTLAQNGRL